MPAGSVSITIPDDVPTGHSQGPVGSGLTPFEDASSAVAALHFIGPVGSFRPDAPRVQSTVTDLTVDLTDDSNERRETLKPTPKVRGRIHAGGVARPATLVEEELREERERAELRVEVHGMPTRLQATSLPADPSAVIDWNHAWTLVVEGRPLYPRVDFMLLRQDLVIGATGQTQEHPAPTTPPWVHEGMRRRARLDSVAPLALARAEAEGNDGEGTPPTAFVQDVAVRQYRDAWMYMVHGMGQGLIHCLWDGSLSVFLNCQGLLSLEPQSSCESFNHRRARPLLKPYILPCGIPASSSHPALSRVIFSLLPRWSDRLVQWQLPYRLISARALDPQPHCADRRPRAPLLRLPAGSAPLPGSRASLPRKLTCHAYSHRASFRQGYIKTSSRLWDSRVLVSIIGFCIPCSRIAPSCCIRGSATFTGAACTAVCTFLDPCGLHDTGAVAEQAHVPCPDTASPLEETVCLPIHQSYSLTYRGTPWAG